MMRIAGAFSIGKFSFLSGQEPEKYRKKWGSCFKTAKSAAVVNRLDKRLRRS